MSNQRFLRAGLAGAGVIAAAMVSGGAALAQDGEMASLDALVDGSASEASAIVLAGQLEQAGDLSGAAAALERLLMARPNAHDARLRYAALLCRLDDRQGARVEMAQLGGHRLGADALAAAGAACNGLALPEVGYGGSGGGVTGEIYLGLSHESDAGGAFITQFDVPALNIRPATAAGTQIVSGLRVSGKTAGYNQGGGLYGSFSMHNRHSISGGAQDLDIVELRAGFGGQSESDDFAIGGVFRHVRLFDAAYLSEYGIQASKSLMRDRTSRIAMRGEAVWQDYKAGPGIGATGGRYDLSASYERRLGEKGFLAIGIGYEIKDARVANLQYHGPRLFAGVQVPVGDNGMYTSLSATLRRIEFDDNSPALDRRDTRFGARAALGVPISGERLFVEAAANYSRRDITSRPTVTPPPAVFFGLGDYDSIGGELRLVFKFGK